MNNTRRFVTTASAIALAAIAISAVAMFVDRVSAAGPPSSPSSWPAEPRQGAISTERYGRISHDDFHTDSNGDEWYVIRGTDSSGNTHARAYRADTRYSVGYRVGSPDEVCYVKLRRQGDEADLETPQQVVFPREREERKTASVSAPGTGAQQPDPDGPVTIRQILATMSEADQASAILCLPQIAGNTDPDAFLDDPANVQIAIDAGCLPAQ